MEQTSNELEALLAQTCTLLPIKTTSHKLLESLQT